ncbi:site-specific DNA-methyltransferase [Vreelandella boliviensis]|uniref:site-specific DNA-methyltransferase n=1 Tax=Vreelandella boliviensis TaxID=223527 RepID=UPI001B8D7993|nr:site-specific DNA-methyltransferase [Halomonas boliviensis]MBS3670086.1 site-specific DNA-methyltransferase [Halomonas boliviensis]
MNEANNPKFQELVAKLREIFQIDQPELDFGIYRILNARADEINEYLEKRLPKKVQSALSSGSNVQREQITRELKEKEEQYTADGLDPGNVPKVQELRQKLAEYSAGASEHENAVFSHLLTFFSRYYDNGDFISQRRYKGDTYAIPYSGEEVMLHWANKDQYYTKNGENFANYSFKLDDGRTVHFRLVSADTAKDNRKDNDKERRFVLIHPKTVIRTDEQGEEYEEVLTPVEEVVGAEGTELTIRFEYAPQPKGTKQDALVKQAVDGVLNDESVKARWLDLGKRAPTEKNPQRTQLEKYLTDYTTKNNADYFIHKNLGGFLRRELDFYIKNEVMHLDDVQDAGAFADIEKNLRMIQCLRTIALELIGFLAQLEDFQKKLWLKKKLVVSSHYCITLDRVPEELYPAIANNERQWGQWHDLGMRKSLEPGTVEDLKANPYLMVDTALYDATFRAELINAIPDLDSSLDGLMAHSDNFQALTLLGERYSEKVRCVYIDPPYNTASNSIPYKNSFKHSAWATMMDNRVAKLKPLMPENGAIFVSIDKHERQNLDHILSNNFGEDNHIEELIWAMNTNNSQAPNYSTNHEYVLVYAKNRQVAEQDKSMFREPKPGYAEMMELVARLNPHYPPISAIEEEIKKLFEQHQIEYRSFVADQGLEWESEKGNDPWKGLYNYRRAEYRDKFGKLVTEAEAKNVGAIIWIWQEDNTSMPASKQSPTVNDPSSPNYRWYQPIHPITGKSTPHPKSGWKFALERDPENPGKRSFKALDEDGRIAWGEDEKKVPRIKRMLHEVETNVGKSVFTDYSDGEKQTHNLFNRSGVFLAPKHANFVSRFVLHSTDKDSVVLDCFGGSGSTAHATVTANRLDGGKRKYITVEQGDYFNTIIKPRMQKVAYSADWRLGKPTTPETGISHCFKVLKLESYEDTLNNLQLRREVKQNQTLDALDQAAKDDYLLHYMLDVESRGSLLSVEDFNKPFDYAMNIATDSAGAYERTKVDLVETFNYLIGLSVKHIDAQPERGFVTVTGTLPSGESCLVLWRDCELLDYEGISRLCDRLAINPADNEFDVVYINGDHNIPTVLTQTAEEGGGTRKLLLRQIEPEFLDRMFTTEDV